MRMAVFQKGSMRTLLLVFGVVLLAGCGSLPTPAPLVTNIAPSVAAGAPPQQAATSTPFPTAPAVAPPTYLVQRGDVQEILEFPGRWEPRDQLLLSFSIQGTVRRVNVRVGDAVQAGQLLADYQIDQLENQLRTAQLNLETARLNLESGEEGSVNTVVQAEISLANARLSLERTKQGNPWTSVASAKIQLDNARVALENAQRDYDDAISRPNLAASQIIAAYDRLVSARSSLKAAEISYSGQAQNYANYQFQIAQAENAVIQAEIALENARKGGGTDPSRQQAVISAQLQIDQINQQIAQSSLVSPIDAEVLQVNIKPGDAVQAFNTVIVIGRPEPKEISASLAFNDASRLSIGLIGIAQVVNRPETAVECIIRRLPASARDADQTTRIAASLEDLNLRTGQLITVQMPLQVARNVLWLPPVAVRTFQNRTFVVLQTPDGPRSVNVEIGLRTDERVEIRSGVNEGDVVIGP